MRGAAGIVLIALGCLVGCNRPGQPAPEPTADSRKAPELAWAREKAEAFLRTLTTNPNDWDTLAGLTGGTLDKNWWVGSDDKGTHFVKVLNKVGGPDGATGWEITFEAIAPDRDEALFRGVVKGDKRSTRFTLVVGKEADGKWRVTAFGVGQAF